MYVCNNKRLIIGFMENSIQVKRLTSDGISAGRGKVKIRFILKYRTEDLVFTMTNIFYFLNSLSNSISLGFLNDAEIYYYNKDQILYNFKTQKTFVFTKQYKTSFFLHLFNLLVIVVNLLKNSEVYKKRRLNINQTSDKKLFLIYWYQCLRHLNFNSLKKHLFYHNIPFIYYTKDYMCNNCKKVKSTKQYNQTSQQRATKSYQYINIDFMRLITFISFRSKQYFFTFTNNYTYIIKIYTAKRNNKGFKCQKTFYNLAQTRTKQNQPTKYL